jgi:hypothetical protein
MKRTRRFVLLASGIALAAAAATGSALRGPGATPTGTPNLQGTNWEGVAAAKIFDMSGLLPPKGVKGKTPITIAVTQTGSDVTFDVDFPIEPFGPYTLTGEIGNDSFWVTGTDPINGTPVSLTGQVKDGASLKATGSLIVGSFNLLGIDLYLALDLKVKAKVVP